MSIAELVPSWRKDSPELLGASLEGKSLRERSYKLRAERDDLEVTSILEGRGIEDVDQFLAASLKSLPDPSILMDMDLASARLADAIMKKERILVFGDYDVDGACSSAIFTRFVRMAGHDCDAYIPDRAEDGYGPSKSGFSKCWPDEYDLVVFVDCGTASADLIDQIKADVIIVDHHKQQGALPFVHACVNPHREDDTSELGMMCAAGLVFLLAVATRRTLRARSYFDGAEPNLRRLLDLAALATVSDVVPLVGVSRILVASGLEVMKLAPSVGVSALMSVAGVEEPSAGRIGFGLGPRINAAGRVGGGSSSIEGALGFEILVCDDPVKAHEIAARLNSLNGERQAVEKTVLDQAMDAAAKQVEDGCKMVCVASEDWHQGVIGIVAGRLREKFGVPAIVAAITDGKVKGSGRSVPGFDLGSVVIEARSRGMIEGGGGHAMACGLSVSVKDWDAFVAFANERAEWVERPVAVDCRKDALAVVMTDVSALDRMEPVGQGNPAPVVAFENFTVRMVKKFGKGHVRLLTDRSDMEALFWRAEDEGIADELMGLQGQNVSVIGVARIDEWQGRQKVSINATDVLS